MARFPYKRTATDGYGYINPSASILVNLTGTSTAATIYESEAGSVVSGSTVTSSSTDGSYEFWVDEADYADTQRFAIVISKTGFATRTISDIVLFPTTDTLEGLDKTDGNFAVANGSAWVVESGATARTSLGAIATVVEDTTPQLGGNLDVNGKDITSPDGTDLIDIVDGAIDIQTNSSSRLDFSDSGIRLGGANARVTTVLDEDAMGSDSATALATQQSIKKYVDDIAGIWDLLSTASASSSASLDFTTSISTNYLTYIAIITDLIPATDTADLHCRLSESSGFVADEDYRWAIGSRAPAGEAGSADDADNQIKLAVSLGTGAGEILNGTVWIYNLAGTSMTVVRASSTHYSSVPDTTTTYSGGLSQTAEANDGIQFLMSSGNIASGTIKLYGLRV